MKSRLGFGLILNLLVPGLGHIYYGQNIGLLVLAFGVLATLGLSYLAAQGPSVMAIGATFNFIFHIAVMVWLFLISKKQSAQPARWSAYLLAIILIAIHLAAGDLRRVRVFRMPSDVMAPKLLSGDYIAVDRFPTPPYRPGQFVVVKIPSREGEFVREVRTTETDSIVVGASDQRIPEDSLANGDIIGQVLYIAYSLEPSSYWPRWSRFLTALEN